MQGELFLGTSTVIPTVRMKLEDPSPQLDWVNIIHYGRHVGEVLAAFEILLDDGGDLPFTPPKATHPANHYIIPFGIRPVVQKMRIEVRETGF